MSKIEKKHKATNKNLLDQMLSKITPAEQRRIDDKMNLAAAIIDALKEKGWKQKDLMEALESSSPSLISKYLSGTHNFTVDTLSDIGRVLGVNFLNFEFKDKIEVLTFSFSTHLNVVSPSSFYKKMPMAVDEEGCLQYNI
ncbi:XRE family transcriptional regulator [Chitinophaga silvatica]|uniref:XRE family transcriptional regulator n=1 Tax=Chitinophaga silvatica TaxID=2282649 RepID=A0A3E1YG69_9BACT|nr:helix-turn-helix transcriptional regulator [Chitinophaga silvatica]RFS26362.1 XRE family transcriptional regulator [Chitinophaga silvatica]